MARADTQEKIDYLKTTLSIKEGFVNKEHERKKELMFLRDKLGKDNAILRNTIAEQRHKERIEIIKLKK